ncbi:MAG: hypothetical protein ACOCWK_09680 [Tangfeifania sp.]
MDAIRLFVIRLLFGKYSFVYQEEFRSLARYGKRRSNFLKPCSKVDALTHYRGAADYLEAVPRFHTDQPIVYNGDDFGVSFRKVKRQKGKFASYDVSRYGEKYYWKRLGYRQRIFNSGVHCIYHFLDNVFFFGEFFFSDVRKVDSTAVARSLMKKYCHKADAPSGNFRISGSDAFIFFQDNGINLSVKYISTSNGAINAKLEAILSFKPLEESAEQEEVMQL